MARVPISAGVFTFPGETRLIAGRCGDCQTVSFPRPQGCPRCTGRLLEEHLLPIEGRLWSWTVQRFRPKPPYLGPEVFEPYGVGYVEFPGECIVEGRLTTADPAALEVGAPMRLALLDFAADADGDALTTYAFAPAGVAV